MEDFPKINPPPEDEKQQYEGVKNLKYDKILQNSFVYLIVGKPGCGKSHLISELITREDFYFQKFNKIIYISPSRIPPQLQSDDDPFFSSSLTDDHLQFVIDSLTQKTRSVTGRLFNFLFVLDDCVGALRHLSKGSLITNLFFNRRHLIPNANISIIVTTQEFKSITAKLRSVVTGLFLFSPGPRDIDVIKSQYVLDKVFI